LSTPCLGVLDELWGELWVSLASLLRSYSAVHGLNRKQQAAVEWGEEWIVVRYGEEWLELRRRGATVSWKREDGQSGVQELTETGRLRSAEGEEEMDLAAEAWARELMQ
jgi:hypothetical protein